MTSSSDAGLLERSVVPVIERWLQERALMLHLADVEREAVLAAGGTPSIIRT